MAISFNEGNQTDCCILAGNFDGISGIAGCLISANLSAKLDIIKECGNDVIFGPTVGSLSITAYTYETTIHDDCQGRAGVSIPWQRHFGCDPNGDQGVYFIKNGSGSAFVAGNVRNMASLVKPTNRLYPSISISSQGGPASIGTYITQMDGAGLVYNHGPINFDSSRDDMIYNFTVSYDQGSINEWYLQNFSLELTPGELPIASYSFMFYLDD